jgi:hypothetical protein
MNNAYEEEDSEDEEHQLSPRARNRQRAPALNGERNLHEDFHEHINAQRLEQAPLSIEQLKEKVAILKERMVQLTSAMLQTNNLERQEVLLLENEHVKKMYERALDTLKMLQGKIERTEAQSIDFVIRLAKNALDKKFKPELGHSADSFWERFSTTCENFSLSRIEAYYLLNELTNSSDRAHTWFKDFVMPPKATITMDEMRISLFSTFLDAFWRTHRLHELLEIRYLPKETVKDFVSRFQSAVSACEIKFVNTQQEYLFLRYVLFVKLPVSVQRFIGSRTVE